MAATPSEPEPGTTWVNVHTGRYATVSRVAAVAVLDGERRVFVHEDTDLNQGNGWSLGQWYRCWRPERAA